MLTQKTSGLLKSSLPFVQHARKQLPNMWQSLINSKVNRNVSKDRGSQKPQRVIQQNFVTTDLNQDRR